MSGAYVFYGALCGLGVNLFSNAVRKLPYLYRPYEHVIALGVGGYAGYRLRSWEQRQVRDLADQLESMGKSSEVTRKLLTKEE